MRYLLFFKQKNNFCRFFRFSTGVFMEFFLLKTGLREVHCVFLCSFDGSLFLNFSSFFIIFCHFLKRFFVCFDGRAPRRVGHELLRVKFFS